MENAVICRRLDAISRPVTVNLYAEIDLVLN